ncbi:MAG TPA: multidrug transporter [candidate division Zixibacteria bacterium]|nr:multidrug transporter [candidate division Zixibacteria bacterium]HEQ98280.1 multidrug transporter [candidate division Zixibacteria bacterium]
MSEEKSEKIVIFGTHGPEDPELACLPFVIGNAALVLEVDVTIMLQGSAVLIAKEGCHEHVFAAGLPPLSDLIKDFIEQGGKLLICSPCIQERKITPDMLVKIAQPVKAARAVMEMLEATQVLSY